MKKKFKGSKLYKYLRPFASWRFLISFGCSWTITNGIWYVLAFVPLDFIPTWLSHAAKVYIGILYMPWTPEKFFLTIPLAIWIHIKLFKNDTKTKLQLEEMLEEARNDWLKIKK